MMSILADLGSTLLLVRTEHNRIKCHIGCRSAKEAISHCSSNDGYRAESWGTEGKAATAATQRDASGRNRDWRALNCSLTALLAYLLEPLAALLECLLAY